ncbi:MAG TPA: ABC transporter ATP-binding protein, partial [Pseudomonadales bacterium]|nr:ABC transporter ATP-binding protein [Pseudomonadales bacterium]
MPIICVDGLVKRYPRPDDPAQSFAAVNGISLSIERGEVYGILGPNGAGKTTTLEMIEGLLDIDGGEALVDELDVRANPYAVKQVIGVQLQDNEYFDHLSLVELLNLFAGLYGQTDFDALELLRLVDLEDKAKAKPAGLSGGQRQRFSIA